MRPREKITEKKKCKLMRICKKRSPLPSDLHLNNSTPELTSEFCDLGLVTNCNHSLNNHIGKITSKANKILGLIKRTCRGLKDVSALGTVYLAFVRSQLEFCSAVWSPHQASDIMKFERVQRRATKLILKTTDEYQQRREKLNLLSLDQRRFLFDVLFLCKALNGHIDIDLSNYVQFLKESDHYMLRRKGDCTLKKNYARTNTFKYSYFNRIVDVWNSLPHSVRLTPSIKILKRSVKDILIRSLWFSLLIILLISVILFITVFS